MPTQAFLAWARRTACSLGQALTGPDEAAADRRLRAELPNLRAARDLARARGDLDLVVDVTLALDEATIFRDLEEVWRWPVELADDPADARPPRGRPASSAVPRRPPGWPATCRWPSGSARRRSRPRSTPATPTSGGAAGTRPAPWRCSRAGSTPPASTGRRPPRSRRSRPWPWRARRCPPTYGGDTTRALDLVRQAAEAERARPCPSHRAFVRYAEGEALAAEDPQAAIAAYEAAIDGARTSGAGFVEGVARVGLASVWTSTGDLAGAVRSYLLLLDYWNLTGSATQLWTTLRNVARLVLDHGLHAAAALLLAAADGAASASRLTGDDAVNAEREQALLAERLGPRCPGGAAGPGARHDRGGCVGGGPRGPGEDPGGRPGRVS